MPVPRCAFLTTDDLDGYVVDDERAAEALRALGWTVEEVSWREETADWDRYDVAVVRSTWDYHRRFEPFLEALSRIDRSSARLLNPLPVLRWNVRKTYLRELESAGVDVVPTAWRDRLMPGEIDALFEQLGTRELIVKPVVGAGADGLFRIEREGGGAASDDLGPPPIRGTGPGSEGKSLRARIETAFRDRPLMAQPFVPEIECEGEHSLCYFGGRFAHAVRKIPAEHDFRVQEERGAHILPADPPQGLVDWGRAVIEAAEDRLGTLDDPLLYARVDLVRTDEGPRLMELELIEPALYFRIHPPAGRLFAETLNAMC